MTYGAQACDGLIRPAMISTQALAPSTTFTRAVPFHPYQTQTHQWPSSLWLRTSQTVSYWVFSSRLYMIAIIDPQLDNSQCSRNVPAKRSDLAHHVKDSDRISFKLSPCIARTCRELHCHMCSFHGHMGPWTNRGWNLWVYHTHCQSKSRCSARHFECSARCIVFTLTQIRLLAK